MRCSLHRTLHSSSLPISLLHVLMIILLFVPPLCTTPRRVRSKSIVVANLFSSSGVSPIPTLVFRIFRRIFQLLLCHFHLITPNRSVVGDVEPWQCTVSLAYSQESAKPQQSSGIRAAHCA